MDVGDLATVLDGGGPSLEISCRTGSFSNVSTKLSQGTAPFSIAASICNVAENQSQHTRGPQVTDTHRSDPHVQMASIWWPELPVAAAAMVAVSISRALVLPTLLPAATFAAANLPMMATELQPAEGN